MIVILNLRKFDLISKENLGNLIENKRVLLINEKKELLEKNKDNTYSRKLIK
jgi:hypothetical protein